MINLQPDSETVNRPFSKTKTIIYSLITVILHHQTNFHFETTSWSLIKFVQKTGPQASTKKCFVSMFLFRRALILALASLGSDRAKYNLCKLSVMLVADAVHHCNLGCMCIKRQNEVTVLFSHCIENLVENLIYYFSGVVNL